MTFTIKISKFLFTLNQNPKSNKYFDLKINHYYKTGTSETLRLKRLQHFKSKKNQNNKKKFKYSLRNRKEEGFNI